MRTLAGPCLGAAVSARDVGAPNALPVEPAGGQGRVCLVGDGFRVTRMSVRIGFLTTSRRKTSNGRSTTPTTSPRTTRIARRISTASSKRSRPSTSAPTRPSSSGRGSGAVGQHWPLPPARPRSPRGKQRRPPQTAMTVEAPRSADGPAGHPCPTALQGDPQPQPACSGLSPSPAVDAHALGNVLHHRTMFD